MKTILTLLLALGAAIAHADSFEERAQVARARSVEKPLAEIKARNDAGEFESIRLMKAFGAAHSGFKSDPVCVQYSSVYSCNQNGCYSYETKDEPKVRLSNFKPRGYFFISSCEVALRNGLLCEAKFREYSNERFHVVCYDRGGNQSDFSN